MAGTLLIKRILSFPFSVFILFTSTYVSGQQENLNVFDRWIEWTDGGNMLVHHLNKQAFTCLDIRDQEISGLKTAEDWKNRQKKVRDILMETVGPFPDKTPLNAKITGIIQKEDYKIEKVLYESRPGFYVTGCLYIPEGRGRRPAILYVSGHSQASFRNNSYQVMILNLVKKGFIVFAIDPISQGERVQIYDPEQNASLIGPTTREHNYIGNQSIISGVSLARYFIWDGIRGIDYLLTRGEVDPERIGVTGQSGGGTQSTYIFAFDERIKAGAPTNYITGFRRLLESIGPQDAEQNFYHGILNGITHADLLEVRAPAPVLIGAGTRDFFSIQGTRETFAEVKNAYVAFGQEENIKLIEDDYGHGYTQKLREGICAFFQQSLNLPGEPEDEDVTPLDPEELMVTATGNIASSLENAETVFSLNRMESQGLVEELLNSRNQIESHLIKVRLKAKELSGYQAPDPEVKQVFRGRYRRDGYSVEMYALEGEGECIVPLLLFVPDKGEKFPGLIYIHPEGKITDAEPGGRIERLVREGYMVAAPDLTGTGETSGTGNVAMLIGRSLAGIQAGDVVRVVNFLKTREDVDTANIAGLAFDEICPTLLHAATMERSIHAIILSGCLISYRSMVMNELYYPGFAEYAVAGALTEYDLPDLMGCIAPGKIALLAPKDQLNQPATLELTEEELKFPRSVYALRDVEENLYVATSGDDLKGVLDWCFK